MKHIIIGTAGHIDHGKTTFIKALTGRNTDRLKEEQKRGISIELGFTYFDLPNGQRAGVIDVPGHEKFIKNMLAGVLGIDIVVLIVAADEGVMPQTIEHLDILNLIGAKKGFTVLTKASLVDKEWLELVKEEVIDSLRGTFLENRPILAIDSVTKEGIAQAINLIQELTKEIEDRDINELPRLPIDRVFTISGFGTVVTGTLLAGKLSVGDEIEIYPSRTRARIRSLQVHDNPAETAFGGQRVAINLAGIKKNQVERGDTLSLPNSLQPTMMIDAKVKLLKNLDKPLKDRSRLKLYIGAQEVLCRLALLDRDTLEPGDEALVQLRLEKEAVAKPLDKFILRFYSPMYTVGGGEILDVSPSKRKRFDNKGLEDLMLKATGDSKAITEQLIRSSGESLSSVKQLAIENSMHENTLLDELIELIDDGKVICFEQTKDKYPVHIETLQQIGKKISDTLNQYHRSYPLRSGISKEEIRKKYLSKANDRLAEDILDYLEKMNVIQKKDKYICVAGFEVKLTKELIDLKNSILEAYKKSGYDTGLQSDLLKAIMGRNTMYGELATSLLNAGELVKVNNDLILLKEDYDNALKRLQDYLAKNSDISLGQYRDLLNTNRKVAMSLLESFDQLKITKRVGEKRLLN